MTIVVVPAVSGESVARNRDLQPVRAVAGSGVHFLPELGQRRPSAFGPLLAISEAAFARVMKRPARSFLKNPPRHRGQNLGTVAVDMDASITTSRPANVGGVLRGNDPLLRDEWIVVTAHYDHLGMSPDTTREDRVYNGADDNASGTAAVIELARALSQTPHRRSILLLLVSGEERGLLGSAYFAANSPIPLEKVVVDLNIDMIGRSDGTLQAATYGSESLFQTIASLAGATKIEVVPEQHPEWRTVNLSDDFHFARRGVPAVEFFTGLHSDYHQPSDEAEKVHYAELAGVVTLIEKVALHFADGDERPQAKWPAWFVLESQMGDAAHR
jgi:Iap family predicted aminopeptidase